MMETVIKGFSIDKDLCPSSVTWKNFGFMFRGGD